MNGSAQLPQYVFDPVTQKYTLKTPAQQSRSGLGSLYDAGGTDSVGMAPSGRGFSMSPETAVGMQNFGLAMQGVPSMATQALGALSMGVPSAFGYATPSPVADPSPMSITAIGPDPNFADPTSSLAAANAAMAAEAQAAANQASVANTAEATATAVGEAAESDAGVGEAAAAAAADAASDAGGGGDSGGTGGDADGGGNAAGDASAGAGDSSGEREGGMIRQRNYKAGGLASAAQHVQDQGREGDSMLVHMSPSEVRGLQAIAMQHGGSLTVNPKTGLVEANFLKSILPMIAGAALTATGVGAPIAALMVGGGYGLATGSLEKGLMAGLGAFGGANLAAGLSAAGATAPAVTGTTQGLAAQGAAGASTAASAAPTGLKAALPGLGVQTGATTAGASLAPAGSSAALQAAASGAPQGFAANLSQMGTGFSNVVQGAPGAREALMQTVGGPMGLATKVAGPIVGSAFSAEEPDEPGKKPQEYIRPYSFDFKPSAETDPNFRFRTGAPGESTAEQRYFSPTFTGLGVYKAGTEPGPSFYGTPTQEQLALYSGPKQGDVTDIIPEGQLGSGLQRFMAPSGGFDRFAQNRIDAITGPSSQGRFSAGGIAGLGKGGLKDGAFIVPADVVAHLGNGSNDAGQKLLARGLGARPIKGKGDGMSDSIPTSIEGRQPARVADGEAYIPPEVVKKVGSKRLYNMMAKIRQARTGTKKQAPEVNPREFMPA